MTQRMLGCSLYKFTWNKAFLHFLQQTLLLVAGYWYICCLSHTPFESESAGNRISNIISNLTRGHWTVPFLYHLQVTERETCK